MPNQCIQLTADQRAFNVSSVSFCEVIYNQSHQAAATDAGRYGGYSKQISKETKRNGKMANSDGMDLSGVAL